MCLLKFMLEYCFCLPLAGDIIIVVGSFGEGWMKGHVERTGKYGLVPSNFVKKT